MMMSKLQCRKCGYRFNYEFIPGMSVDAMRLGMDRYMRCPKCRKWGRFSLLNPGREDGLPTYSDTKTTARYTPLLVVPIIVWIFFSTAVIGYAKIGLNPLVFIVVPLVLIEAIVVAFMMLRLMPQKVD